MRSWCRGPRRSGHHHSRLDRLPPVRVLTLVAKFDESDGLLDSDVTRRVLHVGTTTSLGFDAKPRFVSSWMGEFTLEEPVVRALTDQDLAEVGRFSQRAQFGEWLE